MNPTLQKLWPHLAAFGLMLLLSFVFFAPYAFEGKVLTQSDNQKARAIQSEIHKVREATGQQPLWTNSQFAGMPAYQIYMSTPGNLVRKPYYWLLLGQPITAPHTAVLLAMLCTYLLLLALGADWRLALGGAALYGLNTYHVDLAEAGHSNKLIALAYVPAVFAGMVLVYKKRWWLGAGLFGLALALQLYANHLQITFYTFLLAGLFVLAALVFALRDKTLPDFLKGTALLVLVGALAALTGLTRLWTTWEYTAETIRGKSDLKTYVLSQNDLDALSQPIGPEQAQRLLGQPRYTPAQFEALVKGVLGEAFWQNNGQQLLQLASEEAQEGLDKDYIFGWSYGIYESFTLLVPHAMGGGASEQMEGTELHKAVFSNIFNQISQNGTPPEQARKQANLQVAALMYWGEQPFVGVAIYLGAVVFFLFVLGLFLEKSYLKWWLASAALLSLMLAWGDNFALNPWLVDHVPMFNKFRAVSMALGLTQFAVVALAVLGLQRLNDAALAARLRERAVYMAAGVAGGLCLLLWLLAGGFDMVGKNDEMLGQFASTVREDRLNLLRADALRSLGLILLAAGLAWAYLRGYLKAYLALPLIVAIGLADVWAVNRRVLTDEKYETPLPSEAEAQKLPADEQILQDPELHYRVLDLVRGNPFTNANTSFFHKSIGGYHAAKLMRFQDVVERYLQQPTQYRNILAMLNTKYIIQNAQQAARLPEALGNAWFVDSLIRVPDGNAELEALGPLDPARAAVVRDDMAAYLEGFVPQADSTASIRLTAYHPDTLQYAYTATSEQLAVFSEIYYPPSKGWRLLIDGEEVAGDEDFVRVNYLLRAARLPAGEHRVTMLFAPSSYYTGERVALFSSLALILLSLGGLVFYFRQHGLDAAQRLVEAEVLPPAAPKKASAPAPSARQSPPANKGKKKR